MIEPLRVASKPARAHDGSCPFLRRRVAERFRRTGCAFDTRRSPLRRAALRWLSRRGTSGSPVRGARSPAAERAEQAEVRAISGAQDAAVGLTQLEQRHAPSRAQHPADSRGRTRRDRACRRSRTTGSTASKLSSAKGSVVASHRTISTAAHGRRRPGPGHRQHSLVGVARRSRARCPTSRAQSPPRGRPCP